MNQEELDRLLKGKGYTVVHSTSGRTLTAHNACMSVKGTSKLSATGVSRILASGTAVVKATDTCFVLVKSGRPEIVLSRYASASAHENASIDLRDNTSCTARGSVAVVANHQSTVTAYDNAEVDFRDQTKGALYGSARADAAGQSKITLNDTSSANLFGLASAVAKARSVVAAHGDSNVLATDNSEVNLYGTASAFAEGQALVRAFDGTSVVAVGTSIVHAYGRSSVKVYGRSTVYRYGGAAVEVGLGVKVHDMREDSGLDGIDAWADENACAVQGDELLVYKAVNNYLQSPWGLDYPVGQDVTCDDWRDDNDCGGGLHLSPHPHQAESHFPRATRMLLCAVKKDETRVIDAPGEPKLKAPSCRVIKEVDLHGRDLKK